MNDLEESLVLTLQPRLSNVHPAVNRVLAWARLQGIPADTLARIELPLVEAVNNAVEHGCAERPAATVVINTRVDQEEITVAVRDPGCFVPPANRASLPEDPLAEGGRGGFIIEAGTDAWSHGNEAAGHTLTLSWHTRPLAGHGLEAAASLETTVDRLTEDLANSFETLLGLSHFAGLLATSANFSQLLAKVHERLRTMLAHDHLLVRFIEGDLLVLHRSGTTESFRSDPLGPLHHLPASLPLALACAECECARHRRPLVGNRSALAAGDPLASVAEHLCVLTVEFGNKVLGSLAVLRGASLPAFSAGEVELLQAVADFVGIAKATDTLWQERNQQLRLEQEIQVAAGIQRSLLPASFPTHTRWWVHGECRPAREVGGDYFDVVSLPDGSLLLLIADVMGKGVPAALLAAMLRSSLRALAAVESSPALILTGINRQLFPDLESLGMFITAVLVILPAGPKSIPFFANAGHCAPAILHPDDSITEPSGGDVPLGVLPDTVYHVHDLPLARGDRLFLYTDGCYEVAGADGVMLGEKRFVRFASAQLRLDPPDFVSSLLDPAILALNPAAIADDRTLLVANLRP